MSRFAKLSRLAFTNELYRANGTTATLKTFAELSLQAYRFANVQAFPPCTYSVMLCRILPFPTLPLRHRCMDEQCPSHMREHTFTKTCAKVKCHYQQYKYECIPQSPYKSLQPVGGMPPTALLYIVQVIQANCRRLDQ